MKKQVQLKRLLFMAILSCTLFVNAQITVDNKTDTNAMYSDLQTAINAANTGDTIYVHSSITNYGSIEIDKEIVLVGRTPRTKPASISSIEIKLSGSGTIIKGLVIQTINTTFATNLLIQNNYIATMQFGNPITTNRIATIRGNYIWSSISSPKKTLITNNIIQHISSIAEINSTIITQNIFLEGSSITNSDIANGKKALVQNSIFLVNSTSPRTLPVSNLNLTNCILFNYGGATYEISDTSNNYAVSDILENTNPQFVNYGTSPSDIINDFTLKTGSPAIAAGLNGQDIGVMGNGYSYRPSLHPYGFPTIEILTSTAHVPENGTLKVTFTGKSN